MPTTSVPRSSAGARRSVVGALLSTVALTYAGWALEIPFGLGPVASMLPPFASAVIVGIVAGYRHVVAAAFAGLLLGTTLVAISAWALFSGNPDLAAELFGLTVIGACGYGVGALVGLVRPRSADLRRSARFLLLGESQDSDTSSQSAGIVAADSDTQDPDPTAEEIVRNVGSLAQPYTLRLSVGLFGVGLILVGIVVAVPIFAIASVPLLVLDNALRLEGTPAAILSVAWLVVSIGVTAVAMLAITRKVRPFLRRFLGPPD